MLNTFTDVIKCEVCGGDLFLDLEGTIEDYNETLLPSTSNIFKSVEEIIGKYLIFKCVGCSSVYKYTFKDIEYALRRHITEILLLSIVRGEIINNSSFLDKFFIYCGKCGGFDGRGICPKTVFNKCDIKRFPKHVL